MSQSKTFEILYKPYSKDVMGYILRIADLTYIVINSNLSKADADETQATLIQAYASAPEGSFILLQGNGRLQKTEDFDIDILERAC